MIKWTSRDQAQLDELLARKKMHDDNYRVALIHLIQRAINPGYGYASANEQEGLVSSLAAQLIANAGAFRDALDPFDDGQRPPQAAPRE